MKQQTSYTNTLLTKKPKKQKPKKTKQKQKPEVRSEGNTHFIPAAQQQLTHQP